MNRKTSLVWQYLNKKTSDIALCLICKNDFKYKNNTSNLRDHLKRKHVGIFESARGEVNDPDDPSNLIPAQRVRTTNISDLADTPSTSTTVIVVS